MAASSGSPITQVNEGIIPAPLTDAFVAPAEAPPAPLESPNSPNPGAKPVRPPKAAKRPSTSGNGASRKEEGASEGTTLVGGEDATGTGGGLSTSTATATEAASATTVNGASLANAVPGVPPVAPVLSGDASGADTTKRSSTASQSASGQTGESTLSKDAPASSVSPPNTTSSTTSPAPSAADAKTSSTAAPPAASTSTSAPAASTARSPPSASPAAAPAATKPRSTKSKKGKGPFSFLTACFSCGSASGHDDTPPNAAGSGLQKRPSTAARIIEKQKQKESASSSSSNEKTTEKEKAPTPVEPETAITPPQQEPLAAADPDTPAGPPPPTAGTSQTGVVLSIEETEGVTSGAVVPPGQAAAPHPPATKTKRKRSGKHAATAGGTDGIITSVPEPGARGGGIIMSAPGSGDTSDEVSSDDDEEDDEDEIEEEEEEDEEAGLIARGGVGIPIGEDGLPHPLLDELSLDLKGRKCLVLDLDETLVHSSFKMVHQADYVVPVEIENQFHNVYVIKRPGVDGFLKAMGEIYEVVVFTASLSKYADPVLDQLDVHRVVKHRLFRESCYNNKGNYVKDLSQLGRPMEECIIIDNSPASYVFHPNNAVPISSWFNDPHDTELTDLVPFLTDLATTDDVRAVLDANLYQHLQPVPGGTAQPEGVAGTGFVQA
ncbi:hypothetical protein JCM11251_003333 [Rhodosporidiobolus azoricus]